MEPALLLHVHGVSKSFPGVKALADMHLDLRAGEVLALVGENGAGKSTLMKLLSGVYTVDEGEFFLNGEPYEPTSPKHAQELGISIIHQEFNLMPDLTVAQNIFIGREPRGSRLFLNERRLNARAQELIERLHLPLRPKELVGNLTVAKQQMVEIGKALSYDAKLLIMDEPTAALNEAEVEVLHDLIRRFVRPDTGVIYISHRMDEIRRIADRVTVIRDGRYVGTRETRETTMKEVISMMVGRELAGEAKPVGVQADREVVLEVSGLSTKELLKDVSFELRKGEILGFAGLMGAGRTEVARAVVGADKVDSGTIRLRGQEIRIHTPAEAAKHRIGYLSEDRKQFGLLLEQEVVIAKWLVKDCDILIFDEPTRGIDVGAKEEIYRLLNELARRGKSIIMISSELPEILRMSHRIVVMSEGRVTGTLDADEATQESVMHYATLRPDENPEDAAELGLAEPALEE